MSGFAELRGDAALAVYVDLKSPYAFLAIRPTLDLARALGVEADWRPFVLDIPSYLGSARLDERGRVAESERTPAQWRHVRYSYLDARRYANLTGRTLRGTVKIWDSSLAGIALLWAKRRGREALERFLDEAYARFWRRELDVESLEAVEALLRETGCGADGFRDYAEGPGRADSDEIGRAAFDAGVFGVPTYLAGDEMWFGREHLPRVAWLLGGAEGPPPDVANRSFAP